MSGSRSGVSPIIQRRTDQGYGYSPGFHPGVMVWQMPAPALAPESASSCVDGAEAGDERGEVLPEADRPRGILD